MQTGVILRRNANKDVPTEYTKLAVEANPTAWGAAYASEGVLYVNKGEAPDVDFVEETFKAMPDSDVTFQFANIETALNIDDVSPYPLLSDGENPLVVGFVDGNFPGSAKTESSHPPEFFYAHEYLAQLISTLADMVDNDLDKLMTNLAKPAFKKQILQGAVSRGVVTLIAANGAHLTYSMTDTASEYPWGWVSNNYGYAVAGPPAKEEKPRGAFPKRGGSTVREAPPAAALAAQQQRSTTSADTSKSDSTTGATAGGVSVKNIVVRKDRPGSHLSRKDTGNWYRVRIGYKPKGWEKGIEVPCYYDDAAKKFLTMSQIKEMGLIAAGIPERNLPPREDKDTEPDHITSPPTENGPAVTTQGLPIISPASREWLKKYLHSDNVKKIIAENGEAVSDPKHVQELEAKISSFAVQAGYKDLNEFVEKSKDWTFSMFLEIAQNRPDIAAVAWWNDCNYMRKSFANKLTTQETQELAASELKPEPKGRGAFPKRATG